MKVQNITNQLSFSMDNFEKYPHVRSNPGIVHYKEDMYLMTYRLFVPERKLRVNSVPIPWKSRWRNNEDTTVLTFLRLKNGL